MKGDFRIKVPRETSSKQTLDLIAEHQDAFRTGNASSTMTMAINIGVAAKERISYSEGYLAWWENNESNTDIAVHNIESGKRFRRVMPDREMIRILAVSSTLLTAVSFGGRCYIWAHSSDGRPYSARLPSAHIASVCVLSNTVILHLFTFLDSESESSRESVMVIKCAVDTQRTLPRCQSSGEPLSAKTSEMSIETPERARAPHFFIDHTGTHVIMVCRLDGTKSAGLFLAHYNLKGHLEFEGHIADLHDGGSTQSTLNINESSSAQSEYAFNIWSLSRLDKNVGGRHGEALEYTHAVFYPGRRTIEIRCQSLLDFETERIYGKAALLWKGILCSNWKGASAKSKTKMRIVDLEKRIEGYHDFNTLPLADRGKEKKDELFGNEIFIVHLCDQLANVWCFDKNIKMSGEVSESEECQ